ncbi:MAG: aldehyde dehydrogenase [Rikenellaceae bacterium]|nr:aldehyde dehydrogenase [Rikenellaceae bacterium]
MPQKKNIIEAFISLGSTLNSLSGSPRGRRVADESCLENPWFTPRDIYSAARAISSRMLDPAKLHGWAARYPFARSPRNVAVIMAGNIPLAGFFDLLCVAIAGHRCLVKYSSKDKVSMEFILAELVRAYPGFPASEMDEAALPDAVIASGSDNTIRHLKSRYGTLPALYRGNRASAAVLTGIETARELEGLARDIFTYNGLGCRNVSHLLIPEGYRIEELSRSLSAFPKAEINPKYLNNFRQRRAVLDISGQPYTAGSHFILRESDDFPAAVSEITFSRYLSPTEVTEWAAAQENRLQCIVTGGELSHTFPFPAVPFGAAQSPALHDYPDRVDTMEFLAAIR